MCKVPVIPMKSCPLRGSIPAAGGISQIYAGTSTGHLLEFRATMEKEKRAQESAEAISRHSTTSTPHNNSIRLAACKSVGKKPVQVRQHSSACVPGAPVFCA